MDAVIVGGPTMSKPQPTYQLSRIKTRQWGQIFFVKFECKAALNDIRRPQMFCA